MATFRKKETSIVSITMLLAFAAFTPKPLASVTLNPVLAQSAAPTSFPSPTDVSSGTTVRIDGSSSMDKINQALKERFEKQFPGAKVEISRRGSDLALKALLDEKVDLAAIGRPLSEQEKAQGLVLVPLSREKIAVIVGPDNPFKGGVTFVQFARIFRGEITNWSQLGGPPGAIRLVDRPDGSDTRRIFQSYNIFQNASFKTGTNAQQIGRGSTSEVIKQLGKNGISYAIADQVLNRKDVRVLRMHGVLPTDPKYPFSQPLSYVYKGPKPKPAVVEFIGYATHSSNDQTVNQAIGDTSAVAPSATASPNTAGQNAPSDRTETATSERGFPWWWLWLLGIPLLGGLLWWLLKDRGEQNPSSVGTIIAPAAPAAPAVPAVLAAPAVPAAPSNSSLFLVPYDGKNAYAYWQLAPAQIEALRRQGGEKLMLRLYDVTGFLDPEGHRPYCLQQSSCEAQQQYLLLSLPGENRDYTIELGYLTQAGGWLPLTRSGIVRVTPSVPAANVFIVDSSSSNGGVSWLTNSTGTAVTVAATPSYGQKYHSLAPSNSLLFLVPYDGKNAYAYWQIAPAQIEALQRQGGEKLVLRLYDVTDIPDPERHKLHSLHQFDCNAQEQYLLITLPAEDRDYMVELGYLTQTGSWLPLTRSGTVQVAAGVATDNVVLSLMLRDSKNIYAYWEIPPVAVAALKHQGDKS